MALVSCFSFVANNVYKVFAFFVKNFTVKYQYMLYIKQINKEWKNLIKSSPEVEFSTVHMRHGNWKLFIQQIWGLS